MSLVDSADILKLKAALAANPKDAKAYIKVAEAYGGLEDAEEEERVAAAIEFAEKGVELGIDDQDTIDWLLGLYWRVSRFDALESRLKALLAKDPENSERCEMLAKVYVNREDSASAVLWFQKAHEADSSAWGPLRGLGKLFIAAGRIDEAKDCASKLRKAGDGFFATQLEKDATKAQKELAKKAAAPKKGKKA